MVKRRIWCSLFMAAFITGVAGCPSSSESDAGDGDGDAGNESNDAVVAAYSNFVTRCTGGLDLHLLDLVDPAAKEVLNYPPREHVDYFEKAINSPYVVSNEAAMESCIAYLETASCDDADLENCWAAFTGTLEEGEPCFSLECADGLFCVDQDAVGCGVCAAELPEPAPRAGEGESCEAVPCADQLTEFFSPSSGSCVCVSPAATGDPCFDKDTYEQIAVCEVELYCDEEVGVCQPYAGIGESCGPSSRCSINLKCNYSLATPVCEEFVKGETAGDACDPTSVSSCGGGVALSALACVPDGMLGVCTDVTVVDLGEACNHPNHFYTQANLWCAGAFSTTYCEIDYRFGGGTCQARPIVGEECDYQRPCVNTAFCEYPGGGGVATCVPAAAEGEPCGAGLPPCQLYLECSAEGVCARSHQFPANPETCWEEVGS